MKNLNTKYQEQIQQQEVICPECAQENISPECQNKNLSPECQNENFCPECKGENISENGSPSLCSKKLCENGNWCI